MKLLYSQWMQELDAETINGIGVPSIVLMENASKGAADFFAAQYPLHRYRNVIVIAGKGNNGGDGFAAGRILHQKGYQVHFVSLATPEKMNPDPLINFNILKKLQLPVTLVEDKKALGKVEKLFQTHHHTDTFIMDAIFGTGLNKPIRPGLYHDIIEQMNRSPFDIAAVDIPSGLSDAFLPEEGIHIDANVTATFHSLKTAHLHPDGNKHCGSIRVVDIGIPEALDHNEKYFIDMIEPSHFRHLLIKGEMDDHKGSYGHTLTICGSIEKPGAGILSSYAVLRSGAGLCTAAVIFENRTLPISVHPELMTQVYDENTDLLDRLPEFNSILIGPGMGNTERTSDMVALMLKKAEVPLIMDADALNVLAAENRKELLKRERRFPVVLTPHPGEFSRLTGRSMGEIKRDRIGLSRSFAMDYNVYLILKGHHTLVATPEGRVYMNTTGNPGMATAGSGDVLSGMLAGLVSRYTKSNQNQKTQLTSEKFDNILDKILAAAVFIHGYAGDRAVDETGEISLTAGDILDRIPEAIRTIDDYRTPFPIAR
jgi:ADP-dependent NAD(P)H-hydrate dehydratase / NAD(P)H-hydrate epimerase